MITFPVTLGNIVLLISVIGTMFAVYLYFRKPQIVSDQNDALMAQSLARLDAQFQAHLIADQTSFQQLNQHVVEVDKSIVRLETIIDERIPKSA